MVFVVSLNEGDFMSESVFLLFLFLFFFLHFLATVKYRVYNNAMEWNVKKRNEIVFAINSFHSNI